MKVFFETYGCKVNMFETAAMMKLFTASGFSVAQELAEADVVVLNSCTVTENSDRKARSFVRKVREQRPDAVLLLCGCFTQAFPDKAGSLGADILMGTTDRKNAPSAVLQFLEERKPLDLVHQFGETVFETLEADELIEHTRAFLKIQDGCEKYCSYCAIPKARGPVRSMPLSEVRRQAESFVRNGYQEIVLCGINLSAYGNDLGCDLGDAVEKNIGGPQMSPKLYKWYLNNLHKQAQSEPFMRGRLFGRFLPEKGMFTQLKKDSKLDFKPEKAPEPEDNNPDDPLNTGMIDYSPKKKSKKKKKKKKEKHEDDLFD